MLDSMVTGEGGRPSSAGPSCRYPLAVQFASRPNTVLPNDRFTAINAAVEKDHG